MLGSGTVRRALTSAVALAAWVTAVGGVSAQRPIELGVDAGVRLSGNGSDIGLVAWELPVSAIRIGLHVSQRFSIESSLSASRLDRDTFGSPTVTAVELLAMGLYHFGSDRASRRFHLMLGIPVRRSSASDGAVSISDTELGLVVGGVGLTLPLADHLAMRAQARALGWEDSTTRFSFLVGFSYLGGG